MSGENRKNVLVSHERGDGAEVPVPPRVTSGSGEMHAPQTPKVPSERMVVLLVAAVQFVNILDFMMVMPLGPDFAAALGIPTSHIGMIGGSYTLAAAAV